MEITQETDNYNVVLTGSVFTFGSEPIKTKIVLPADTLEKIDIINPFIFKISFRDDPNKQRNILSEIEDFKGNQILSIYIYNVDSMGGTSSPLLIAKNDKTGKKTYISIAFQKLGESYLCSYTIFLEK